MLGAQEKMLRSGAKSGQGTRVEAKSGYGSGWGQMPIVMTMAHVITKMGRRDYAALMPDSQGEDAETHAALLAGGAHLRTSKKLQNAKITYA